MGKTVAVIDYGIGNLQSVRRALEVSGCEQIHVTTDPALLETCDGVVLPGVGAFADGMRGLREAGWVDPIRRYAASGKPLMGICLGMQMLASSSEEFGTHAGLDLIPGSVVAIPRAATSGEAMKAPFIGWTRLDTSASTCVPGSLLERHDPRHAVYLVHSYHVLPRDPAHVLATYPFGGHAVTAAIRMGNVTGFQFHPEKSGEAGLALMRQFIGGL